MKVQKVVLSDTAITWVLLGDDFLPIEPVQDYLDYLRNIGRSPNTVRSYAFHLKLYWEYLKEAHLKWDEVKTAEIAEFMMWLRSPSPYGVVSMQEQEAKRTEATVNAILTSVCMLYDFHERTGQVPHIPLYHSRMMPGQRYKGFLHHITKGKPVRTRLLKLKVPRRCPKTVTAEQVEQLVAGCHRIRDKFLVCLLYDTGMRIGQAISLRITDIHSWDNKVWVIPRENNANHARAKTKASYCIDVSKELMELYTEYLEKEFMEILGDNFSDYVFVNLWDGSIGSPMTYSNVMDLFNRLKRKTGIAIHPHMLRHSHSTELIRQGVGMHVVQKRLGHASIQTTMDTYVHVSNEGLKQAYQDYLYQRERKQNSNDSTSSKPIPQGSIESRAKLSRR